MPRARPMLTREQELRLVRRAQEGSRRACNRLIEANMGFVYQLAHKIAPRCHTMDADDLAHEGVHGIRHAIRKFDLSRPVKFLTYAAWWIRETMMRAIANKDWGVRLPVWAFEVVATGRFRREWDALAAQGLGDEDIRRGLGKKHGWSLKSVDALSRMSRARRFWTCMRRSLRARWTSRSGTRSARRCARCSRGSAPR